MGDPRTKAAWKRIRPGRVGARGLRIGAVSGLVLIVLLGGATALWLSTRASEPDRAASTRSGALNPPVRLDALPRPQAREQPRRQNGSGREERTEARRPQTERATGSADGDRASRAAAAKAEKRREIAALAAEDAELEAALSGDRGPGSGTGEVVSPALGEVIARFGRVLGSRHAGIDIDVPTGTPVNAADSGRVALSGKFGGYGNLVCIQHTGTLSTCYAHLSRLRVDEGDSVDFGEVIAVSGCTGRCYEPHLHFEVRDRGEAVDPKDYL
ncbi:MAG: hypothetical protein AVDCRST_MAG17-176 [uncultured Solirubrobacterales bacterium]|uniref:M23ase beta-sheet core domain-containing protein n=1 Tax=uncultured Solirubrobacterales bacterium TaxID=768556 RepID=A0A6J4RSP6_9ACTN|nr:MAG: hypothetical protein AVDCRST_MAG17-176 [uncultured Solirubrobacterales bacterium]